MNKSNSRKQAIEDMKKEGIKYHVIYRKNLILSQPKNTMRFGCLLDLAY